MGNNPAPPALSPASGPANAATDTIDHASLTSSSVNVWLPPDQTTAVNYGYINEVDKEMQWEVSSPDQFVCGLYGQYHDRQQDRTFKAEMCTYQPGLERFDEYESGYCNLYKEGMGCECRENEGIYGFWSQHESNGQLTEDRRWKIKCAPAIGTRIKSKIEDGARWTNKQEHKATFDHKCTSTEVMCGMSGYYWGAQTQRDRGYAIKCCPVEIEQTPCNRIQIEIERTVTLDTKIHPEKKSLDQVEINACGYDQTVKRTLKTGRTVQVDETEKITFVKSMENSFTHKTSTTLKIGFGFVAGRRRMHEERCDVDESTKVLEYGVDFHETSPASTERRREGDGGSNSGAGTAASSGCSCCDKKPEEKKKDNGSVERSFSTTQTSKKVIKSSQTDVTYTKKSEKRTFSENFFIEALARTVTKATRLSTETEKAIEWFGTATCYDGNGAALESVPANGRLESVKVTSSLLEVETLHCPTDGWATEHNKFCHKSDLMKDADNQFIMGFDKFQAVEWCELEDGCECVIDLNCKSESLQEGWGFLDKQLFNVQSGIPGNYMYCKTGCSSRLLPSHASCTMYEDYPDLPSPSED